MNAAASPSNNSSKVDKDSSDDVEYVFSCIQKGHAAPDPWQAAECYLDAYDGLLRLHTSSSSEQPRLQALYHQQSQEYYRAARTSLVAAMQEDNDAKDAATKDTDTAPPHEGLALSERTRRAQLFQRFYFVSNSAMIDADEEATPLDDPLPALERRLQQLRTALPPHLQTEAERDQKRQRQLQRLGIFTTDNSNNNSSNPKAYWALDNNIPPVVVPTTPSDEVQAIIIQVQEELALEQQESKKHPDPPPDKILGENDIPEDLLLMNQILLDTTLEEDEAAAAAAELGAMQSKKKKKDAANLSEDVANLLAQAHQEGLLHSDDADDDESLEDDDDELMSQD